MKLSFDQLVIQSKSSYFSESTQPLVGLLCLWQHVYFNSQLSQNRYEGEEPFLYAALVAAMRRADGAGCGVVERRRQAYAILPIPSEGRRTT